jgi:hypothetical protein
MKQRFLPGALAAAAAVAVLAASFGAGYFVAERHGERLLAEQQLASLMNYVPVLGYVRTGDLRNAKKLLYAAADGAISTFSRDEGATLSAASREILPKVLLTLNQAWTEDRPFDSAQWSAMRSMPGWAEMRRVNDAFRERFAAPATTVLRRPEP